MMYFPLLQVVLIKFFCCVLRCDFFEILKIVDLSFLRSLCAVFSLINDIGFSESAIANKLPVFVFSFTIFCLRGYQRNF